MVMNKTFLNIFVAFKMFSVLNYTPGNTSADLTLQCKHILRAGADELRTQQASTLLWLLPLVCNLMCQTYSHSYFAYGNYCCV